MMKQWTPKEQLYYYLEHCCIEADWISMEGKKLFLNYLPKAAHSMPRLIRLALLYDIPLYDADGVALWTLEQE